MTETDVPFYATQTLKNVSFDLHIQLQILGIHEGVEVDQNFDKCQIC